MKYPDAVTVLRPSAADEYGNPSASWDAPSSFPARAFVVVGAGTSLGHSVLSTKAFFPVGTDLREGDRLLWNGATYDVEAPHTVRSPSKAVLMTAGLSLVEATSGA